MVQGCSRAVVVVECRPVGLRLLRFSHLQVVVDNLRALRLRAGLRYLHQFRAGHQRVLVCLRYLRVFRCLRAYLSLLRAALAAGLHSNLRALVIGVVDSPAALVAVSETCGTAKIGSDGKIRVAGLRYLHRFLVSLVHVPRNFG